MDVERHRQNRKFLDSATIPLNETIFGKEGHVFQYDRLEEHLNTQVLMVTEDAPVFFKYVLYLHCKSDLKRFSHLIFNFARRRFEKFVELVFVFSYRGSKGEHKDNFGVFLNVLSSMSEIIKLKVTFVCEKASLLPLTLDCMLNCLSLDSAEVLSLTLTIKDMFELQKVKNKFINLCPYLSKITYGELVLESSEPPNSESMHLLQAFLEPFRDISSKIKLLGVYELSQAVHLLKTVSVLSIEVMSYTEVSLPQLGRIEWFPRTGKKKLVLEILGNWEENNPFYIMRDIFGRLSKENINSLNEFHLQVPESEDEFEIQVILQGLNKIFVDIPLTSVFQVTLNQTDLLFLKDDYRDDAVDLFDQLENNTSHFLKHLIASRYKGKYNRGKVMFVGDGGVGKTTTIRTLYGEAFRKERERTKVAQKVDVVDVSNSFQLLGKRFNKKTTGFAMDLKYVMSTVVNSFEQASSYEIGEAPIMMPYSSHVNAIKSALSLDASIEDDTSNFDISHSFIFTDEQILPGLRNADNPIKLSIWDFGGQRVFDALHPLYLTDNGIYVLVLKMTRFVNAEKFESSKKRLEQWFASLSLYAPQAQVILVGTCSKTTKVQRNVIKEKINACLQGMQKKFFRINIALNGKDLFFPIENSKPSRDRANMNKFKEKLRDMVKQNAESTWEREIELSWMFFMHHVISLDPQRNVISMAALEHIAKEHSFPPGEMDRMVRFFTKAGEILDFRTQVNDSQKLSILLNPPWLLDVLGTMICCRDEKKGRGDVNRLKVIADNCQEGCKVLVPLLLENAVLSSLVLKKLLKDKFGVRDEEIEFVCTICEKMLIMAKLSTLPNEIEGQIDPVLRKNTTFWVLPCYFSKEDGENTEDNLERSAFLKITEWIMQKKDVYETKEILWQSGTPLALFERFICFVINRAGRGLEIKKLNGLELACSLKNLEFAIQLKTASRYLLKLHLSDPSERNIIMPIIQEAYMAVHYIGNISFAQENSEFYVRNRDHSGARLQIDKTWDCFLSHSWGVGNVTHQRVLQIAEELRKLGISPWVDNDHLKESVGDDIRAGIDGSHIFIAFITNEYLLSSNDRNSNAGKEFRYKAEDDTTKIIPVVLDPALLDPRSWKGTHVKYQLPDTLYVDFSSEKKQRENIEDLAQRINDAISME